MVQFRAGMVKQSPENSAPKFISKQESISHCAYCEPSKAPPLISNSISLDHVHKLCMNPLSLQNDINSVPESLSWTFLQAKER